MNDPIANPPRILVAGIGNIFLGDDAFGVELVTLLARRPNPALPDSVRIIDFGIRGLDLAYALLDPYDAVIFLDASPRGGTPGTPYVLEPPRPASADPAPPQLDTHSMDPMHVLQHAIAMGARIPHILVLGCEPSPFTEEDMAMGLSPRAQAALPEALNLLDSLLEKLLQPARTSTQMELFEPLWRSSP